MSSKIFWMSCPTNLGPVVLVEENQHITHIILPGLSQRKALQELDPSTRNFKCKLKTPLLRKTAAQIQKYLNGKQKTLRFSWKAEGTPFQKKVWKKVGEIPFGATQSYGEIALKIGNPKAARAVGSAVHHNPLPLLIPCHRVVGTNGSLVGFAGGLGLKKKLLRLEGSFSPKQRR